jgi:hypothetical protein
MATTMMTNQKASERSNGWCLLGPVESTTIDVTTACMNHLEQTSASPSAQPDAQCIVKGENDVLE